MDEEQEYTADDLRRIGEKWLDRILQAEKREEPWRKEAEAAEAIYLCDNEVDGADLTREFNILHSNVETIVPSIYNSTPRPEIRAKNPTQDDIAKDAAEIEERVIGVQIENNALDEEIEAEAQDVFVAGRGVVRVKFDADIGEDGAISSETIVYENVSWRDYREGPSKRWGGVPWVAYGHEVSEKERERLENPELWDKQLDDERDAQNEDMDCTIWEIWCKETRKVYFVTQDTGKVINILEDPLGLKGFFPQPKPIQPITGTGRRTPVCPFTVYKALARELDNLTKRINRIMQGLKVRGLIAGDAEVIELLAHADDNELVPAGNIENLAATGGLDKAVMWWPLETAVKVLAELYKQREATKQAIYEVTGISDIVRGQGQASETATAQQIKTQWGSLRIKKMQRLIERQVRDLFALTAEMIGKHFTDQTIQQMAGMEVLPQHLQLIRSPLAHYRIDVESDSTVRADLTKSRREMSEFLTGTAQFFQAMLPVAQSSPAAIGSIARMYASFASQFNLGKSASDALDELVALADHSAKSPKPNPEAEKLKLETQMKEREFGLREQEIGIKGQQLKLDALKAQAEHNIKLDDLELREAQAEVDAAATFAEIDLEKDQERPVEIN